MEQSNRIKIKAGKVGDSEEDLYLYFDQIKFFHKRSEEEKTKQHLKDFTLRWGLYNAIDEYYEEDNTCNLVWDDEASEAYFVFDDDGIVSKRLKELGLL